MGWIRHGDVEYDSPLGVVRKKDSVEIRLCVSYMDLNAISTTDATPLPLMDTILGQFGKSEYFSTADCCKGYYAVKIDKGSQKYAGFVFANACYFHTVMPFGLKIVLVCTQS